MGGDPSRYVIGWINGESDMAFKLGVQASPTTELSEPATCGRILTNRILNSPKVSLFFRLARAICFNYVCEPRGFIPD
jgi:hypothetical protein